MAFISVAASLVFILLATAAAADECPLRKHMKCPEKRFADCPQRKSPNSHFQRCETHVECPCPSLCCSFPDGCETQCFVPDVIDVYGLKFSKATKEDSKIQSRSDSGIPPENKSAPSPVNRYISGARFLNSQELDDALIRKFPQEEAGDDVKVYFPFQTTPQTKMKDFSTETSDPIVSQNTPPPPMPVLESRNFNPNNMKMRPPEPKEKPIVSRFYTNQKKKTDTNSHNFPLEVSTTALTSTTAIPISRPSRTPKNVQRQNNFSYAPTKIRQNPPKIRVSAQSTTIPVAYTTEIPISRPSINTPKNTPTAFTSRRRTFAPTSRVRAHSTTAPTSTVAHATHIPISRPSITVPKTTQKQMYSTLAPSWSTAAGHVTTSTHSVNHPTTGLMNNNNYPSPELTNIYQDANSNKLTNNPKSAIGLLYPLDINNPTPIKATDNEKPYNILARSASQPNYKLTENQDKMPDDDDLNHSHQPTTVNLLTTIPESIIDAKIPPSVNTAGSSPETTNFKTALITTTSPRPIYNEIQAEKVPQSQLHGDSGYGVPVDIKDFRDLCEKLGISLQQLPISIAPTKYIPTQIPSSETTTGTENDHQPHGLLAKLLSQKTAVTTPSRPTSDVQDEEVPTIQLRSGSGSGTPVDTKDFRDLSDKLGISLQQLPITTTTAPTKYIPNQIPRSEMSTDTENYHEPHGIMAKLFAQKTAITMPSTNEIQGTTVPQIQLRSGSGSGMPVDTKDFRDLSDLLAVTLQPLSITTTVAPIEGIPIQRSSYDISTNTEKYDEPHGLMAKLVSRRTAVTIPNQELTSTQEPTCITQVASTGVGNSCVNISQQGIIDSTETPKINTNLTVNIDEDGARDGNENDGNIFSILARSGGDSNGQIDTSNIYTATYPINDASKNSSGLDDNNIVGDKYFLNGLEKSSNVNSIIQSPLARSSVHSISLTSKNNSEISSPEGDNFKIESIKEDITEHIRAVRGNETIDIETVCKNVLRSSGGELKNESFSLEKSVRKVLKPSMEVEKERVFYEYQRPSTKIRPTDRICGGPAENIRGYQTGSKVFTTEDKDHVAPKDSIKAAEIKESQSTTIKPTTTPKTEVTATEDFTARAASFSNPESDLEASVNEFIKLHELKESTQSTTLKPTISPKAEITSIVDAPARAGSFSDTGSDHGASANKPITSPEIKESTLQPTIPPKTEITSIEDAPARSGSISNPESDHVASVNKFTESPELKQPIKPQLKPNISAKTEITEIEDAPARSGSFSNQESDHGTSVTKLTESPQLKQPTQRPLLKPTIPPKTESTAIVDSSARSGSFSNPESDHGESVNKLIKSPELKEPTKSTTLKPTIPTKTEITAIEDAPVRAGSFSNPESDHGASVNKLITSPEIKESTQSLTLQPTIPPKTEITAIEEALARSGNFSNPESDHGTSVTKFIESPELKQLTQSPPLKPTIPRKTEGTAIRDVSARAGSVSNTESDHGALVNKLITSPELKEAIQSTTLKPTIPPKTAITEIGDVPARAARSSNPESDHGASVNTLIKSPELKESRNKESNVKESTQRKTLKPTISSATESTAIEDVLTSTTSSSNTGTQSDHEASVNKDNTSTVTEESNQSTTLDATTSPTIESARDVLVRTAGLSNDKPESENATTLLPQNNQNGKSKTDESPKQTKTLKDLLNSKIIDNINDGPSKASNVSKLNLDDKFLARSAFSNNYSEDTLNAKSNVTLEDIPTKIVPQKDNAPNNNETTSINSTTPNNTSEYSQLATADNTTSIQSRKLEVDNTSNATRSTQLDGPIPAQNGAGSLVITESGKDNATILPRKEEFNENKTERSNIANKISENITDVERLHSLTETEERADNSKQKTYNHSRIIEPKEIDDANTNISKKLDVTNETGNESFGGIDVPVPQKSSRSSSDIHENDTTTALKKESTSSDNSTSNEAPSTARSGIAVPQKTSRSASDTTENDTIMAIRKESTNSDNSTSNETPSIARSGIDVPQKTSRSASDTHENDTTTAIKKEPISSDNSTSNDAPSTARSQSKGNDQENKTHNKVGTKDKTLDVEELQLNATKTAETDNITSNLFKQSKDANLPHGLLPPGKTKNNVIVSPENISAMDNNRNNAVNTTSATSSDSDLHYRMPYMTEQVLKPTDESVDSLNQEITTTVEKKSVPLENNKDVAQPTETP